MKNYRHLQQADAVTISISPPRPPMVAQQAMSPNTSLFSRSQSFKCEQLVAWSYDDKAHNAKNCTIAHLHLFTIRPTICASAHVHNCTCICTKWREVFCLQPAVQLLLCKSLKLLKSHMKKNTILANRNAIKGFVACIMTSYIFSHLTN